MGSVYLGRHIVVGKPVAVKILDSSCIPEGQGFKRLFREAQAAASIGHPNIIDVQDVGLTSTGDPFLVMEYLEGEDLAGLLTRRAPLSLAAACGVVEPILSALNAAHAKGIVHRDLKPANIYLIGREDAPPMVKLIDFGVSKFVGATDQAKLTLPGAVLGTPAYMSPEQARGCEDVDERADLYAIGVVLFQMLTGKLPFEGTNYNDLIFKIVYDEPTLLESQIRALPEDARSLISRTIRKEPADRYQSASELLDALRSLDAWPDRADALSELAASIRIQAFGGGDLGMMTQKSGESPMDVYEIVGRDAVAVELAETRVELSNRAPLPEPKAAEPDEESDPLGTRSSSLDGVEEGPESASRETSTARDEPKRNMHTAPFVAIAGSAAAILLAVLWWSSTTTRVDVTPASSSTGTPAVSAQNRGVQITIHGAPADATIFYDGAPVSMNPFRVRRGETIVPIRVEMPGHKPFLDTVVPSKDLAIEVILVPAQDAMAPSSSGSASTQREAPPPARTTPRPKEPDGIVESGRGTYYTEEFK